MSVPLQSFSESAPGAPAGGLGSWGVLPERCHECWRTWGYEASYLKFIPGVAQPSSLWVLRLELCLRKNKMETTADNIACASRWGAFCSPFRSPQCSSFQIKSLLVSNFCGNWCLYFFYLFIYFWLCCVFVAARGLSLVAASRGYSSLRCAGFWLWWLLLLWSTGSRCAGFSSCGMRAQ